MKNVMIKYIKKAKNLSKMEDIYSKLSDWSTFNPSDASRGIRIIYTYPMLVVLTFEFLSPPSGLS